MKFDNDKLKSMTDNLLKSLIYLNDNYSRYDKKENIKEHIDNLNHTSKIISILNDEFKNFYII